MNISVEWYISYETQAVLVVLGLFLFFAASIFISSFWGAPWIISSKNTIRKMLSIGDLAPGETVVDLGSGDGRILIVAATEFGAKGIGIEIDPLRCLISNLFIVRRGLTKKINIRWGNIFTADFSDVDLVTLYLTRETNQRLRDSSLDKLNPGTRVVSNGFTIPGWKATKIDNQNLIFMYVIGQTGDEILTEFI